jgi:hypothetical protein
MPAWNLPDRETWQLVSYIRDLPKVAQMTPVAVNVTPGSSQTQSHYVGSPSCKNCHQSVYAAWSKSRMANVVRDPRQHPPRRTPHNHRILRDALFTIRIAQPAFDPPHHGSACQHAMVSDRHLQPRWGARGRAARGRWLGSSMISVGSEYAGEHPAVSRRARNWEHDRDTPQQISTSLPRTGMA